MSNTNKKIFCLLNCFNNYEIISSKIIEFYIQNAVANISNLSTAKTYSFFESTPFVLYSSQMNPNVLYPGETRSKQYQQFLTILSLTAVTLAQIASSDVVVFANQGVITMPGFATMYNTANQLNKPSVLWSDDMRNLWGVTDDPLVIGMTPLPHKYLWFAGSKKQQPTAFNQYPKNLNTSHVTPSLGTDKNLCLDQGKVQTAWNTFIQMIDDAQTQVQHNTPGISSHTSNLIQLGNLMITEAMKNGGWSPVKNPTLHWQLDSVLQNNTSLLNIGQKHFVEANPSIPHNRKKPFDQNMVNSFKRVPTDAKNLSQGVTTLRNSMNRHMAGIL